jgi:hypothetical protein
MARFGECSVCHEEKSLLDDGACVACTDRIYNESNIGLRKIEQYLATDPHVSFVAWCRDQGKAE